MNYENELLFLISQLEKNHPDIYRKIDKKSIEKIISFNKNKKFSEREFKLFVAQVVAMFGDPHTCVDFGNNESRHVFKLIHDEIYLVNDESLSKVTNYNGISTEKIIDEIRKYISYENESRYIASIEEYLSDIDFMNTLLDSNNIEFETDDGLLFNLNEKKSKEYFDVNYESGELYIKLGTCNQNNTKLKDFINECEWLVKNSNIESVTLDLRGNKGGSSEIVAPLIDALKPIVNKKTIVDEHTFSSAVLIMQKMRENGATVIGCEPGLTQNHFGNCIDFTLPYSNIKIWCSTCEFVMYNNKIIKITDEEKIDQDNTKVIAYGQEYVVPNEVLFERKSFAIDEYLDFNDYEFNSTIRRS